MKSKWVGFSGALVAALAWVSLATAQDPFGGSAQKKNTPQKKQDVPKRTVDPDNPFGGSASKDPFGGSTRQSLGGISGSVIGNANPKVVEQLMRQRAAQSRATRKQSILTEDDIEQRLAREAAFDYEDTPFSDVMDDLSAKLDVPVILTNSAMDDELTPDEPITNGIRRVSMKTALRQMLAFHNADIAIGEGVLLIISRDVVDDPEWHRNRVFDCRELIQQISSAERSFPSPEGVEAEYASPSQMAADRLVRTIEKTISVDSWENNGGTASMEMVGGMLVVSAGEGTLDGVDRLLERLKKAFDAE